MLATLYFLIAIILFVISARLWGRTNRTLFDLDIALWLGVIGGLSLALSFYFLGLSYGDETFHMSLIVEAISMITGSVISIVVTVLVLDRMYKKRADQEYLNQLIQDMQGQSNEFAKRAIDILRRHPAQPFTCGMLNGRRFSRANLHGVDLNEAKLQNTYLRSVNLRGAHLHGSDLYNANLQEANLQETELWEANLQEADLSFANLQKADLSYADLQNADLTMADLQGSRLRNAILQETNLHRANFQGSDLSGADLRWANLQGSDLQGATLPNGELWHEGIDMEMFINPEHPDFFIPDKSIVESIKKVFPVLFSPNREEDSDNKE